MAFPFKIGGVPLDGTSTLPALKYQGASFSRQAIDGASAGRNQSGKMMRDLVAKKDKWRLEFVPCDSVQMKNLLAAIDGASFKFTYPSPVTGGIRENVNFYCGDRSCPVFKTSSTSTKGAVALWGNLTFDVIEI